MDEWESKLFGDPAGDPRDSFSSGIGSLWVGLFLPLGSDDPLSKLECREIQSTDNGADFSVECGV
jgi:hypothetical protein